MPFRANVWAMASLGVRSMIGPCAVGSLQPEIHPGEFVVVDQLVDRTTGRPDTFHDVGAPPGTPGSEGRCTIRASPIRTTPASARRCCSAAATTGVTAHDGGTMVVINGPRFSTRAESAWFRAMGWHVVNMTGYPEAVLAAEAGIPYASVALVTDYDAGVDGHEPVTMETVLEVLRQNVAAVRTLLEAALPRIT